MDNHQTQPASELLIVLEADTSARVLAQNEIEKFAKGSRQTAGKYSS
jgi:hypothetical protein